MKKCVRVIALFTVALAPKLLFAQNGGFADEVKSLHVVLEQLYTEMLPLCSKLIGVGRGIVNPGIPFGSARPVCEAVSFFRE